MAVTNKRKRMLSFLSVLVVLGQALSSGAVNQRLMENLLHFSSPDMALQKFVVQPGTGEIYLGGTNKLYQLSSDLDVVSVIDTRVAGMDRFCPTANACPRDDEENINRLLQIDRGNNLLISCGSAFSGTCALHDLDNLTSIVGWPAWVVHRDNALGEDSLAVGETVVGFYAPFQAGDGEPEHQVLYVGATYNGNPLYRNITQHAATAKKLEETSPGDWHFTFASQDPVYNRNSLIDVWDAYKNTYKIKYISGFNSGGFNYFTTVQREDLDVNKYHSRIVRICKKDRSFYSYTEMQLICRSQSREVHYNILRAAYVGKAGPNLGFDPGEDVLYGVFSPSVTAEAESGSGWMESDQPQLDSALCVYSMSYINKRIKKGLQDCFNSQGNQGLRFMSANRPCNQVVYRVVDNEFCGTADLQPIEAKRTAIEVDILQGGGIGKAFTSIAALALGDDTVAIVGTEDGHVMKFLLQSPTSITDDSNFRARLPYKDLDVSDSPVLPDMAFDNSKENVYIMTAHEIFKISVSTCEHYVDCSVCVVTHDPNTCGWCGLCSTELGCTQQGGADLWRRDSCPPAIYEVTPLAGPLEGGTRVTITGDNLGNNVAGSYTHEVTIAGQPCAIVQELSEISRIVCITSEVPSPRTGPIEAKIEVFEGSLSYRVNGTISTAPDIIFTYVDPVVTGIEPKQGGRSGGTILTITGDGLNAGNDIRVTVLGRTCIIQSISMTSVTCVTTETTISESGLVKITIDDILRTSPESFTYVDDSIVDRFSPNRAVISGGQTISAFGSSLQYVQGARMEITIRMDGEVEEMVNYSVDCVILTDVLLQCASPNASQLVPGPTLGQPIRAEVAFYLDNRVVVLTSGDSSEFLLYPDPVFYPFTDGENVLVIEEGSSTLTIQGEYVNLALSKSDIKLTVGGKVCEVIDLKASELTCKIPDLGRAEKDSLGYKVELQTPSSTKVIGYLEVNPRPFPWYAILITVLVLVCVVVFLVMWRVRKQAQDDDGVDLAVGIPPVIFHRQASSTGDYLRTPNSSGESAFAGIADENRPLLEIINKDLAMEISEVLINEDNLKQGDIVGQGHFGCVYQGRVWQDGTSFPVAIKTLLRGGQEEIINFMREGIMMKDFKHPHVLELIGVCINSSNLPLVILPFMKHGDLLTYIRDPKNELTARDLLEFCRQVADGMAYLANRKFVHRDLAARNCMLDDNLRVKIADFGLSRDLYERDYYSAKDKTAKLPVRWMAIECLERNVYNSKTDVWSFGVVMWEFLTRGMTPYPAVDNWDINTYLQRGRRLQQPVHCPDHVYQIMMDCWSGSPVDRPTFDGLVKQLTDILMASVNQQSEADQVYLNIVPSLNL